MESNVNLKNVQIPSYQVNSSFGQNVSSENFTALDKEKLKQDSVELAKKAKKEVEGNWISRTFQNTFGVSLKKFLISLGLTAATVVGCAVLGNKSSDFMAKLGLNVDEKICKSKVFNSIGNFFKKAKTNVVGFLRKSKTIDDIHNAVTTNKAKPRCDMTRGYGRGFVSIFSLTPVDTLRKGLASQGIKDASSAQALFKKLVGDNSTAGELADALFNGKMENREFCSKLSDAMRKHLGCGNDNQKFLDALLELKNNGKLNGEDLSAWCNNVKMSEKGLGGLMGSWWPVNIIDSIGHKIRGDKWKPFCRGNLGDSLIKFNAVNGTLANSKIGSLTQKLITVPTESISNFVNDKSGFGVFLCSSIMSLYNNVQDAPKNKRAATIADDYVGTIGSIAISTPLAFATTYGLASLKNVEGKTLLSKLVKQVGKFFGMGLYEVKNGRAIETAKTWKNAIPRYAGGALRFGLIMFAFAPMFSKPIKALINKIFGKPYDKAEEQRKQQLEAQKNIVIPELGITQGELLEKMQKNPQAVQKLQTNPELLQKIDKNPKLILDLLDGKDITKAQLTPNPAMNVKPSATTMSPMNRELLKNRTNKTKTKTVTKETTSDKPKDSATYIPSSAFVANPNLISREQSAEVQQALAKADKVLKRAERYI